MISPTGPSVTWRERERVTLGHAGKGGRREGVASPSLTYRAVLLGLCLRVLVLKLASRLCRERGCQ